MTAMSDAHIDVPSRRTSKLHGRKLWRLVLRSSSSRCVFATIYDRDKLSHFAIQDLKREFVEELIYPAVQANCIYEVRTS